MGHTFHLLRWGRGTGDLHEEAARTQHRARCAVRLNPSSGLGYCSPPLPPPPKTFKALPFWGENVGCPTV